MSFASTLGIKPPGYRSRKAVCEGAGIGPTAQSAAPSSSPNAEATTATGLLRKRRASRQAAHQSRIDRRERT